VSNLAKRGTVIPAALTPHAHRQDRIWVGTEGVREFLVIAVGSERMGLPLASVREIFKIAPVTLVPRAPRAVLGIMSVRGRITTVIDMRVHLGLPKGEDTRSSRILLVDGGDETIGVRVDAVHNVIRLRESEVEAAGVVGAELPEHVLGIGRPYRERLDSTPEARVAKGSFEKDADAEVVILLDPVSLLRLR
jgi:purine-binding chemotaxis protein CheW